MFQDQKFNLTNLTMFQDQKFNLPLFCLLKLNYLLLTSLRDIWVISSMDFKDIPYLEVSSSIHHIIDSLDSLVFTNNKQNNLIKGQNTTSSIYDTSYHCTAYLLINVLCRLGTTTSPRPVASCNHEYPSTIIIFTNPRTTH